MSSVLIAALVSLLFCCSYLANAKHSKENDVVFVGKVSRRHATSNGNAAFDKISFEKLLEEFEMEQSMGETMYLRTKIGMKYNFQFVAGERKDGKFYNCSDADKKTIVSNII